MKQKNLSLSLVVVCAAVLAFSATAFADICDGESSTTISSDTTFNGELFEVCQCIVWVDEDVELNIRNSAFVATANNCALRFRMRMGASVLMRRSSIDGFALVMLKRWTANTQSFVGLNRTDFCNNDDIRVVDTDGTFERSHLPLNDSDMVVTTNPRARADLVFRNMRRNPQNCVQD